MAGGAVAGADGGAGGGGGGGDGRGPSGGSKSSGGRSLQGECPSVSRRLGAQAVLRGARCPGEEGAEPRGEGTVLWAGPPQEALDCRRGRGRRPTGVRQRRRTDRSRRALRGGLGRAPQSPGAEARGVALGAGSAALGGRGGPSGSGLRARGAEGRDPPLPGLRETAPQARARVGRAAGLRPPRAGRGRGRPAMKREQAAVGGRS